MNAKEARELTDKQHDTLKQCIEDIAIIAKSGKSTYYPKKLSRETESKLVELGYKIRRDTDPRDCVELITVSW